MFDVGVFINCFKTQRDMLDKKLRVYQTTRRHIPVDHTLNIHCSEILKSTVVTTLAWIGSEAPRNVCG
jgi:hypothetical protein